MTKKTKKTVTLETSAQIDGKAQEGNSTIMGTLDQIMGESISVYSAASPEQYISELAEMNQTDLQSHAYKVGLIPIEDRKVLVERLVKEYRLWASRNSVISAQPSNIQINDLNSEARKILREGA